MKRQGGFTLIELVVVIVILGILAVTAAPKFLNLQSDARASSLQGLKGAMAGASGIVYGKAAIDGKETSTTKTVVEDIDTIYGYPMATANGIDKAVVGLSDDWAKVSGALSGAPDDSATYYFKGATAPTVFTTGCFVNYAQATSISSGVSIIVRDDKC
ncbi:type II secretion system protein [Aliivibrio fischeri]|uniref:type II secretion system protein n=1 Tax=Aliivibrio fischeri TaxID=668 RepID=UPI0012DA5125|nr:prepilin-type N-terminal cleavage/methylation domain-containing protein [Aliivibrio fischeri]MUJ37516.1 prepilin-type N-terminal cleavage/methylation domain-containing protein [Aliivibrio fischeri]